MKTIRVALLSLLTLSLWCSTAKAADFALSYHFEAGASDGLGRVVYADSEGRSVPNEEQIVAIDGEAYSESTIKWSSEGGVTTLSIDLDHKRPGSLGAVARFIDYRFIVIPRETLSYELSGYYTVTDVGSTESGRVVHDFWIYNGTTNEYIFGGAQSSHNTHNEKFVLGERRGDHWNDSGPLNLNGSFFKNHIYEMHLSAVISANDADSGASAVGNFTLKLGTIPEPSTVALCSIFAVLGLIRRRQIA